MRCPCPKCDAIIEVPAQDSSASGSSHRCPECSEKYWALKEEYVLRAYKKLGRIYCCNCSHELGSEMLCTGCGSMCPDYCVVQLSKPVVRKQLKSGFSVGLARRPRAAASVASSWASPERQVEGVSAPRTSKKWLPFAALAVIILALAGGMTKVYLERQASQLYAKNFIVALYGIKSGTDLSLGNMATLSSEWKKSLETAGSVPRPSQKDLDKLKLVKTRVVEAMDKLRESPEEFADARTNLLKLHGIYEKISALNSSVPESLEDFTSSMQKLETAFFKAAADLRNAMPEELQEELRVSVVKYRNLDFMVKGA